MYEEASRGKWSCRATRHADSTRSVGGERAEGWKGEKGERGRAQSLTYPPGLQELHRAIHGGLLGGDVIRGRLLIGAPRLVLVLRHELEKNDVDRAHAFEFAGHLGAVGVSDASERERKRWSDHARRRGGRGGVAGLCRLGCCGIPLCKTCPPPPHTRARPGPHLPTVHGRDESPHTNLCPPPNRSRTQGGTGGRRSRQCESPRPPPRPAHIKPPPTTAPPVPLILASRPAPPRSAHGHRRPRPPAARSHPHTHTNTHHTHEVFLQRTTSHDVPASCPSIFHRTSLSLMFDSCQNSSESP